MTKAAKTKKKRDKKPPITTEKVEFFHISSDYLNKTSKEVLKEVDCLAQTYRLNKHDSKSVTDVCLFNKDWKKVISSVNVHTKKELRKKIITDCLIYEGIRLRPKTIQTN